MGAKRETDNHFPLRNSRFGSILVLLTRVTLRGLVKRAQVFSWSVAAGCHLRTTYLLNV